MIEVCHSPHLASHILHISMILTTSDNRAAHTDVTGAGLGTAHDTTHGTTTATGTHGSTLGSGTTHGTGVTGTGAGLGSTHATTGSTNAGPHSSNIANKADPRVDSDRDNRARHEGLTGAGLGSTHTTTATGPHSSALGTGTTHGTSGVTGTGAGLGSTGPTTATGTHGSTIGSGTGATHGGPIPTPGTSSTNAGPHSSNIANKLDPRVDSDRDNHPRHHSAVAESGPGTVTHGSHTRGTSAAPSGSAIGGSGLGAAGHQDAVAGSSYNTSSTGTTTGTTGPHSSSIANKLDPRVDSKATRIENVDHRAI